VIETLPPEAVDTAAPMLAAALNLNSEVKR
jgi:hypothetical protein